MVKNKGIGNLIKIKVAGQNIKINDQSDVKKNTLVLQRNDSQVIL